MSEDDSPESSDAPGPAQRVRLQVLLSRAGMASRRGAEAMIREGRVTIGGRVVTELGTKVDPAQDQVAIDGKPIADAEPRVTVVLYKPDGVVSTRADDRGRETVADLVKSEPYALKPVGRLDYHTEGVLLLTTDGELANRLLHPRHDVPKTYQVKVGGYPSEQTLGKLRDGIELEDGKTRPAVVEMLEKEAQYAWLEMIVTEGRNRLVRRMCEAVGHRPMRVVRTEFATIGLSELRPGQFRYLTPSELDAVYGIAGLAKPEGEVPESPKRKLGEARRRKGMLPGEERREKEREERRGRPRSEARGRRSEERGGRPRSEERGRRSEERVRPRTEDRRGPRSEGRSERPRSEDRRGPRSEAHGERSRFEERGRPRSEERSARPPSEEQRERPRSEDRARPRSEDRARPRSEDRARPRSKDRARPRSEDRARPRSEDRARPRSEERRERPRSEDRGRPGSEGRGRPRAEERGERSRSERVRPRSDDRRGPRSEGRGRPRSDRGGRPRSGPRGPRGPRGRSPRR